MRCRKRNIISTADLNTMLKNGMIKQRENTSICVLNDKVYIGVWFGPFLLRHINL